MNFLRAVSKWLIVLQGVAFFTLALYVSRAELICFTNLWSSNIYSFGSIFFLLFAVITLALGIAYLVLAIIQVRKPNKDVHDEDDISDDGLYWIYSEVVFSAMMLITGIGWLIMTLIAIKTDKFNELFVLQLHDNSTPAFELIVAGIIAIYGLYLALYDKKNVHFDNRDGYLYRTTRRGEQIVVDFKGRKIQKKGWQDQFNFRRKK